MRETRPGFRPGFGEAALRIRRRWFWPTYRSKTVATGQPADLAVQPFPDGRILVSGTIARTQASKCVSLTSPIPRPLRVPH